MKKSSQKRVTTIVALATISSIWLTGFMFPSSTVPTQGAKTTTTTQYVLESHLGEVNTDLPSTVYGPQLEILATHVSEDVEVTPVVVSSQSKVVTTKVGMSTPKLLLSSTTTLVPTLKPTSVPTLESTPQPTLQPALDKTKPIYEVYKNGVYIEVPASTQWLIRDMANKYDFDEKIIFGMILAESGFNPNCKGDSERSLGLAQIQKFWINGANITHFTDDYSNRNLLDPEDNILTLMEMWCYARETYDIDTTTTQGMKDLLYWHNSGKYQKNVSWAYSDKCFDFANELVEIKY